VDLELEVPQVKTAHQQRTPPEELADMLAQSSEMLALEDNYAPEQGIHTIHVIHCRDEATRSLMSCH
jgi:hypothetical protein